MASAWRALAACALLLAGTWTHGASLVAQPADEGPVNPRYLLEDMKGHAVSNEDFGGRFQLLTFGYTSCADVCPTTLARLARIRTLLGNHATRLQVLFVTLDPARDTPERLAKYVAYFGQDILALGGSPEQLGVAARHFHVRFEASAPAANGQYSIDHSTGLYLLDAQGEYLARFAPDAPIEQTVARIEDYMAAAAH